MTFNNVKALFSYSARIIVVLLAVGVLFTSQGQAPTLREVLLTSDNAYNPIPSPDGKHLAYVRTGWGERMIVSLGRSSLVSDVKLMNTEGAPDPKTLAKDFFLSGWTPDSSRVVCYRDWRYALVSTEGKGDVRGKIPNSPSLDYIGAEWVAYSPALHGLIWSRPISKSHRVIETPDRIVTRKSDFANERVVPSPDGRYLAVFDESSEPELRVYDLQRESWTDVGPIVIHPDINWSYIQPDWNPWFADGSHLVFARDSAILITKPDGTTDSQITVNGRAGLPTASPDGKTIAFVTFEPRPMKARPDLQFWGSTTIWVARASGVSEPRAVTAKNQDEVLDLKWLNNDAVVFDRIADEPSYSYARIWKATVTR
jgi:Tol biopolymer transport system component